MTDTKFDAVVMAGGFGSRLAPITNSRPKPMLPVNNRSAYERILDLLAENGYDKAAVTVMYLPEHIEAVVHERVEITCFREQKPLGSAGAVRALFDKLADTVLIISGDAICDFPLERYVKRHKDEQRKATLLLSTTKTPQEFGTVLTDAKSGIITRFLEKPSWADTLSNHINTGIYILDKSIIAEIPENTFFDFGRDLFPLLIKQGVPLHGEIAEGFWCDIGSFSDFFSCSMRLSDGKNIIGEHCIISGSAEISESIIFERVSVGKSKITGSIICEGVFIGDGCVIPDGCVIGANSVIGDHAVLSKGIRIAGNVKISRGAKVMGNVFFGSSARHLFGDEGVYGIYGIEIDGELCFKLGQGLSSLGKSANIGVMSDGSPAALLLADTIKTGVRCGGGKVLELEDGFASLASFAAHEYSLDCCVFIAFPEEDEQKGKVYIRLYESNGLYLSREKQRKIESAMRDKLPAPEQIHPTELLSGERRVKFLYCHFLQREAGRLYGITAGGAGMDMQANFFFSNARELGASTAFIDDRDIGFDGDIFLFDENSVSALTKEGRELSFWQLFVLAAQSRNRRELFLPQQTPEAVEVSLRASGFELNFYNDSDSEQRKKAFETHFYSDNVLLALLVCRYLRENGLTLDDAAEAMPPFYIRSIDIEVDEEEKADIIGTLAEECEDCSRGVRLRTEKGSIAVFPRADGGFRIFAEAVNAELADELCGFAEKRIKRDE